MILRDWPNAVSSLNFQQGNGSFGRRPMYLKRLLPVLLAGGPGQPAAAIADDPPIRIWISNDGRFLRGDRAKVHVRAEDDGYLVVLHADAEGHLRVLFPMDPTGDNFVRGGKKYEVEGRGGRDAFDVGDRSGRGSVYAAVSRTPFRFDEFVLSDHWDYRALEPKQLAEDAEPELTELVRRMARGSFDYDVMSYHVLDRVVYASDYSYSRPAYGGFYYDDFGCGYYRSCGSALSVSLFFGRPFYRRSYYGPYHYAYDPFYDPFFYDPYYYRPYYYSPVFYYPRGYYGYPYHYRNQGYYNRWDRTYTPYRFRDRTLANADYRDRRYTFGRAVNTVYTPPVSRFSEPENASPIRRAVDRQEGERPEATVARRSTDRTKVRSSESRRTVAERQSESTPIEARRARPAEAPRAAPDTRGRRESLPVDASPRRTADNGSRGEPAPAREARPAPEARPARRADDSPPRETRSEPRESRSADRGDRGGDGGGRVERAASSSGSSWSGGGGGGDRRGGGGGGSPSSGGGRRR
jgi:uncharacterized membrane protein YgcG